jgi:hypothetical protein
VIVLISPLWDGALANYPLATAQEIWDLVIEFVD